MPLFLKLLQRDIKSGQLTLLLISLIVAVSTITAIALFTSRVHNTIISEASETLAGDAQIRGSQPIPDTWVAHARTLGLATSSALQFRAMAFAGDEAQLGSVKAVSNAYPLRGQLTVAQQPFGEPELSQQGPAPGEVWLNSRLFDALKVSVGSHIEVGELELRVTQALLREPDNPQSFFNISPRIMMNEQDVPATGAVQLGSQVGYRLMLAGEASAMNDFATWLEPQLGTHHRWADIKTANASMGEALTRAEAFLYLAGSLSVVLAGVAVALAARRYAAGRISQVAILKALGLAPKHVQRLYLSQLTIIGVLGILFGVVVGWALQWPIIYLISQFFTTLAPASHSAYGLGALTGIIALLGFALPPIYALKNITPNQVLRQKQNQNPNQTRVSLLIGISAVLTLILLYSRSVQITSFIAIGTTLCIVLAGLLAQGLSVLFGRIGRRLSPQARLGFANLERHKRHNLPQVIMFAMLFMIIFTLVLMRTSLLATWQDQLPEGAPNHFVFNIFPNERPKLDALLRSQNIDNNPYYPMVRGRLIEVNDVAVQALLEERETQVNYERELNLTWSDQLGEDNKIVQGDWWEPTSNTKLLASIEDNFAEGLGLAVGDQLTLSVSGETVTAEVANIRQVQWDSMNPNFYVVLNQAILDGVTANWMTSFYLPPEQKAWLTQLTRELPTLSLIELDQAIAQVQDIINQVSSAIEFIWFLVLAAGVLVLITSIQSTLDIRLQEGAILRVVGASRRLLRQILSIEFASIGLMSGLIAVLGTEILVFLLQSQLFNLNYHWHGPLWLIGPLVATLLVGLIGLASTSRIRKVPPMTILREQSPLT